MPLPKVSVCIPSYNHEKYVGEAIESVFNQTFQDFELIITDDGSTDGTVDKIKEFDDERIRLYVFEENQGAPNALNNCIKNSKGEYIAYISSDDVWELDKLEKQVEFIEKNNHLSAIFSRANFINENSQLYSDGNENNKTYRAYKDIFNVKNKTKEEWLNRFFFKGNCICHPSILIKKEVYEVVGFYNERLANLPDFDMWTRICLNHDIHIMDEKLINFRISSDEENTSAQTTGSVIRMKFEEKQILNNYLLIDNVNKFLKIFPESKKYGEVQKELIPYFLGRIACDMEIDSRTLWGLELIYNVLKSKETCELLKNENFKFLNFIEMTALEDCFHIKDMEEYHELNDILEQKNQDIFERDKKIKTNQNQLKSKNKQLKIRNLKIKKMESSISWKIIKPLRKLGKILRKIKNFNSKNKSNLIKKNTKVMNKPNLSNKNETYLFNKNLSLISNSKLFDEKYYTLNYGTSIKNPIEHYLKSGYSKKFNPNPFFNSQWYLDNINKNLNIEDPFLHYLEKGTKEGLDPHPMFSTKFYIKQKNSINKNINYLKDYIEKGRFEGFVPSPDFIIDEKILSKIPTEHKYKYTSSPILCNVVPSLYLSSVPRKNLHHKFWDFESYCRLSVLVDTRMINPLYEEDLRIISIMDQEKMILHEKYKNNAQDELVSIIMPTHNRADSIPDSIISVISQTYQNWELIIINDGGTDNTEEVVSGFDDNRIVYHELNESKGPSGARNVALSISKGSIIAYLDDDDIWDPDMLLISVNELRASDKKIVYSAQILWEGFNDISRLGNKFRYVRFSPFNRSLLENHNYISMISLVHDKCLFEKLGGFDESLNSLEDWDLLIRYTELEFAKAIPCILNHYFSNRHSQHISHLTSAKKACIDVFEKLINRASYNETLTINNKDYEIFGISKITTKIREKALLNMEFRTVEIIIPNYESKFLLKKCVDNIIEHTRVPFNIIICDNNSSKETQKFIDEMCNEYDNVNWINVNENQGFSYAVNEGLKIAFKKKNDILILNNDVIVTPNWLEEMLLVLDENKDVGMVTSRQVLLKDDEIIPYHVPTAQRLFEVDINLSAHHHNIIKPFDIDKFEINFTPLFCALIQYEDAVSVGYLDAKNGPHFRSDNVYSDILRRKTGKKIVYTPYSKVYHIQGVSTDALIKKSGKNFYNI